MAAGNSKNLVSHSILTTATAQWTYLYIMVFSQSTSDIYHRCRCNLELGKNQIKHRLTTGKKNFKCTTSRQKHSVRFQRKSKVERWQEVFQTTLSGHSCIYRKYIPIYFKSCQCTKWRNWGLLSAWAPVFSSDWILIYFLVQGMEFSIPMASFSSPLLSSPCLFLKDL